MFVLRINGKISSGFGCAQFAGQEEVPDDDPRVITYLQALANPAPSQVTAGQLIRALNQLGLLASVDAAVAQAAASRASPSRPLFTPLPHVNLSCNADWPRSSLMIVPRR
jgi:hypothetical protein